MVNYSVRWDEGAIDIFYQIFNWYKIYIGEDAANKFRTGILNAIHLIQSNPYIGKVELLLRYKTKIYRSYIEHKNHRIIYYIENDIIYIIYIWDNRMSDTNMNYTIL